MSFSTETEKLVNDLINAEYLNAVVNFGEKFNSLHEGYAVLLEEMEEVKIDIGNLDFFLKKLWESIKTNDTEQSLLVIDTFPTFHSSVIKELAQVGAVLQKIKNTLEKSDDADVSTKRKVCNPDCECIHKEFDKWTCWGQKNAPYVELGDECPYQDKEEK